MYISISISISVSTCVYTDSSSDCKFKDTSQKKKGKRIDYLYVGLSLKELLHEIKPAEAAYVSIRQHTSAYVRVRLHTSCRGFSMRLSSAVC